MNIKIITAGISLASTALLLSGSFYTVNEVENVARNPV